MQLDDPRTPNQVLQHIIEQLQTGSADTAQKIIPELRQLQQLLQQTDRFPNNTIPLPELMTGIYGGMWQMLIPEGRILLDNWPVWEDMLGYTEQDYPEISLEEWMQLIHPDDVEPVSNAVEEVLSGEAPWYNIEYRIRHKDGHFVWVNARGAITTRSADDTHQRLSGILIDIHQQKVTQEALRQSEDKFHTLVNNIPGVVYRCDPAGQIIYISDDIEQLSGYPATTFLPAGDKDLYDLLPQSDRQRIESSTEARIQAGRPFAVEYRLQHADGRMLWVQETGRCVFDEKGTLLFQDGVLTDRTEYHRVLDRLRESEEKFKAIINSAKDSIFVKNTNCQFVQMNPAMQKLLKIDAAKIIGTTTRGLFGNFGSTSSEQADERVLHGETIEDITHKQIDGQTHYFHIIKVPLYNAAGMVDGICGIARDITENRRAEEQIRASEAKYRSIFFHAPLGIMHFDQQGVVTDCNSYFVDIIGSSREQLIGLDMKKLPNTKIVACVHQALQQGEANYLDWYTSVTGKKTTFVRILFKGIPDDKNKFVSGVALVENLTPQKETEQALQESEIKFQTMLEQSADAVFVMRDDRLEYVNRKFRQYFELYQQPLHDITLCDFIATQDRDKFFGHLEMALKSGKNQGPFEFRVNRAEGEPVEFEGHFSRIEFKNDFAVQGLLREITERKSIEEQLRQAQKMEAIGKLAGGVAHDFNNLLTIISGYCNLLLLKEPANSPASHKLQQIQTAASRAEALTGQLLAFSRKQTAKPEVLNLNLVLPESVSMLRRLVGEDIDIQLRLCVHETWIKMDPHQLEQILMNLMVNARDALHETNLHEKRIEIETDLVYWDEAYSSGQPDKRTGQQVLLRIRDNGCGMDAETSAKVFEPFFTTKKTGKGTGLGLSTVYGIIQQNDAHISIDSTPEVGTSVSIFLPLSAPERDRTVKKTVKPKSGAGELVLLVEDDNGVRAYAEEALHSLGYKTESAPSGTALLKRLKKKKLNPCLLLTDIVMPGINGRELAEKVKILFPEIHVLFTSGYTDDHIARQGLVEAHISFIQKPYSINELGQKIQALIR